MYPLDAILIGCGDDVAPRLRCELITNAATVESEFCDAAQALDVLRLSKGKRRVLILRLKSFTGLGELGRLCQALPDWPVMVLIELGGEDRIQLKPRVNRKVSICSTRGEPSSSFWTTNSPRVTGFTS